MIRPRPDQGCCISAISTSSCQKKACGLAKTHFDCRRFIWATFSMVCLCRQAVSPRQAVDLHLSQQLIGGMDQIKFIVGLRRAEHFGLRISDYEPYFILCLLQYLQPLYIFAALLVLVWARTSNPKQKEVRIYIFFLLRKEPKDDLSISVDFEFLRRNFVDELVYEYTL